MTDIRPSRLRRWIIVPAVLLGAGAWVVVSRRSREAAPDVWTPRPPAERPLPAPAATPAAATPAAATPAGAAASPRPTPSPRPRPPAAEPPAAVESPAVAPPVEPPAAAPPIRPLLATPTSGPPPYGPGSAEPLPDGSAPGPEYTIKGNAGSMLFHPPSSPYYARTKAEVWFRTPEDAIDAGFTAYARRRPIS